MALLSVEGLSVSYGRVSAVRNLHLRVERGELVALLGANGAGKTSTLHGIMGLVPAVGTVAFDGSKADGVATEELVRRGMTLVPEGRRVFPELTVQENLELGTGARRRRGEGFDPDWLSEAFELFPVLAERADQAAGTLSGGEQQQLAIGRALMSRPSMLLLDEPSLGLAPRVAESIFELIDRLRGRGLTILLVEQNVRAALALASRGYVLAAGEVVLQAEAEELLASKGVERAYLGVAVA